MMEFRWDHNTIEIDQLRGNIVLKKISSMRIEDVDQHDDEILMH